MTDDREKGMGESATPPRAGWYRDPSGGKKHGVRGGSASRPDVDWELNRMYERVTAREWQSESWALGLPRGALAKLDEVLSDDETVECIAPGRDYFLSMPRNAFFVLTDRRLLVFGGRRLGRTRDYPLEAISFAESGWAAIKIISRGKTLRIRGIHPDDGDEIAQKIRNRSSRGRTGRAPQPWRDRDQLKKIKPWHVTEE